AVPADPRLPDRNGAPEAERDTGGGLGAHPLSVRRPGPKPGLGLSASPECGLKLAGSRSDPHLELYFDITRGEEELGYIAKGWDAPGFRVGDVVEVSPKKTATLMTNAFQIMRVCATQGIGISIDERLGGIELALDGVIYSEGFNRETFKQTLDAVCDCTQKVRGLVGSSWIRPHMPSCDR